MWRASACANGLLRLPRMPSSATLAGSVEKTILMPLPCSEKARSRPKRLRRRGAQVGEAHRLQPHVTLVGQGDRARHRPGGAGEAAERIVAAGVEEEDGDSGALLQHLDQRLQAEERARALKQQQVFARHLHAVAGHVDQSDGVGVDPAQVADDARDRVAGAAVALRGDPVEAQLLEAARDQRRVAIGVG